MLGPGRRSTKLILGLLARGRAYAPVGKLSLVAVANVWTLALAAWSRGNPGYSGNACQNHCSELSSYGCCEACHLCIEACMVPGG